MNNLSKEKKQQMAIVAVITIVICVVIWVGLISSQKKSLAAAIGKTSEMRGKVEKAQQLLKRSDEVKEELAAVQGDLRSRESTMADGDYYQWFLSKMIPFTSERPLNNFYAGQPSLVETRLIPKFPYRSASYSVKLNAPFHEVGRFFADIENQFPYARVQNIDLVPAVGTTNELLNISFEFVTLYQTNRAVAK